MPRLIYEDGREVTLTAQATKAVERAMSLVVCPGCGTVIETRPKRSRGPRGPRAKAEVSEEIPA